MTPGSDPTVTSVDVSAYTIPTESPESDGTLRWDSTSMLVVEAECGSHRGVGYSYTAPAAARLVTDHLIDAVVGSDPMDVPGTWEEMVRSIRNLGRPGLVSSALAAMDNALWDLKARMLDLPLCRLLGMSRDRVPVYASGGFTSYDPSTLQSQLSTWANEGFSMVKMKVGRYPEDDFSRVALAREAVGDDVALFVDANGAYERKQALTMSRFLEDQGVSWFEEPVSSDDLTGLSLLRDAVPMDVTAGEYGYDLFYFDDMIGAGAVDVLQVDVTRCGGITEFLRAEALCRAANLPVSSHTAPAQHLHVACALPHLAHMEFFHDHVLIEEELFDGVSTPEDGHLRPDLSRPGSGFELDRGRAAQYRVA